MGFRKNIKEIKTKIDSLTDSTIEKAKKYDEIMDYLENVKFRVKNSNLFVNEHDGTIGVNVEYQVPSIKILFDENNEVIKNNRFIAINMLNLISIEDMNKLGNMIEEAKKRNI